MMQKKDSEHLDDGLLTADMVAKVLMLNVSRIHQMGREGIIPRENGKYRLVPAVQGYIKFLKKDNEDEDLISLSKEKARLTKAQRERAEFELATLQRDYVPASEVEEELSSLVKTVTDFLESLPDTMERDIGLMPEQVQHLERQVRNIRDDLYQKCSQPAVSEEK